MNKDKKVLYSFSLIIFAVLFAALFINIGSSKIIAACLLFPLAIVTRLLIKKRCSVSINKREVLLLSSVIGVIYAVLVQMSGIFFKFYKNPYFVNIKFFLTIIIPLTVIIVSTELIRSTLLAQKNSFVSVLAFLSCVLAEILEFSNLAGITSFNRFMDLVGLTLFPAISANVYYHYVSKHFGALPNIVFRLITTLYIYFIPTVSAISDALLACVKIFLPIIMLAIVSALFEKKKKNAIQKGKKLSVVSMLLATLIITSTALLISCQFRFGAIVIATESMTGEINKGDMIIYERYDKQQIKEGQVIVFLQNENKIIHRVVKIEHKGNETRYYTKGDANEDLDFGYRTEADIVGLTDMKLAYVGFPTLWLRELLDSSN
jgi:signal peptidase I